MRLPCDLQVYQFLDENREKMTKAEILQRSRIPQTSAYRGLEVLIDAGLCFLDENRKVVLLPEFFEWKKFYDEKKKLISRRENKK